MKCLQEYYQKPTTKVTLNKCSILQSNCSKRNKIQFVCKCLSHVTIRFLQVSHKKNNYLIVCKGNRLSGSDTTLNSKSERALLHSSLTHQFYYNLYGTIGVCTIPHLGAPNRFPESSRLAMKNPTFAFSFLKVS